MFNQANEELAERHYDDAIGLYDRVIELQPELTDAYLNRGVAHYNKGKYVLALADYNEVYRQKPDFHDLLFNRAYVYMELGRIESAFDDLRYLRGIYPDTALIDVAAGLLYQKNKEYNRALDSFSQAIQKDVNQFDAYANSGAINYELRYYEEAEENLLRALELHENDPYTLNSLALVYADLNELTKADSCINLAMGLVGNQPYFINNAGYIKYLNGNMKQADSLIAVSLQLDSTNAWAHKNRGLVLLEEDELAAIASFEKSIAIDSTILDSYEGLIAYYLSKNNRNKACQWFTLLSEPKKKKVNNPCI